MLLAISDGAYYGEPQFERKKDMADAVTMNPFTLTELAEHMMRFADADDLRAMRGVSRLWRALADAELERRGARRSQSARYAIHSIGSFMRSGMLRKLPPTEMLNCACYYGSTTVARWVALRFGLIRDQVQTAFHLACKTGHGRIARWLHEKYKPKMYVDTVVETCKKGHLELLKWLMVVNVDADIPNLPSILLNSACVNGYYEIALWLTGSYFVDRPIYRCMLQDACMGGNLPTVKLISGLLEGPADITVVNAMWDACATGHLDVVEWLYSEYRLPQDAVFSRGTSILEHVCRTRSVDTIRWVLARAQQLNVEIDDDMCVRCVKAACYSGNISIAEMLLKEFRLDLRTWPDTLKDLVVAFVDKDLDLFIWALDAAAQELQNSPESCSEIFVKGYYSELADRVEIARQKVGLSSWRGVVQIEDVKEMLAFASKRGNLDLLQRIVREMGVTRENVLDYVNARDYDFFEVACINERIDVAEWIIETFGIIREVFFNGLLTHVADCCSNDTLRWLLRLEVDIPVVHNVFFSICNSGNLDAVKLFAKHFTQEELLGPGEHYVEVIRAACGDYEVATWLMKHFKVLRSEEGRRVALDAACLLPGLILARWISSYYHVRPNIVVPYDTDAYGDDTYIDLLERACKTGDEVVAKWLCSFYPRGKLRGAEFYIRTARKSRQGLVIADWLTENYC